MKRVEILRKNHATRFAKQTSLIALKNPGRPMRGEGAICPVHSYLTVGEYERAAKTVTKLEVTMSKWIRGLIQKELGQ